MRQETKTVQCCRLKTISLQHPIILFADSVSSRHSFCRVHQHCIQFRWQAHRGPGGLPRLLPHAVELREGQVRGAGEEQCQLSGPGQPGEELTLFKPFSCLLLHYESATSWECLRLPHHGCVIMRRDERHKLRKWSHASPAADKSE